MLKRARWSAGQGVSNAVGGASGQAGDAAAAAVRRCLLCATSAALTFSSTAGVLLRALAALHQRLRPCALRAPLPPHVARCVHGLEMLPRKIGRGFAQPQQLAATAVAASASRDSRRRRRRGQRQRSRLLQPHSCPNRSQRRQASAFSFQELCSGQLARRRQGGFPRMWRQVVFIVKFRLQEADDAFDDLEDFLWQPGMPL